MTRAFASEYPQPKARERIIAALDVAARAEAREIVDELRDEVGAFKIGSQLFTAAGPDLVREFTSAGVRIFLDLKFHDIPNTVAKAAIEAARLGVWMLNVHTLGGSRMMMQTVQEVRQACEQEDLERPLMIGVTILTSSGETEMNEIGIKADVPSEVLQLARLAAESGLDGVVASPHESRSIREAVAKPGFIIVTPGIRPASATNDDQRRVTTFMQAIQNGSDYVVIGRPIIQSADRRAAVRQIIDEVETTK